MVTETIWYSCSRSTLHQGLGFKVVMVQDPWKKLESRFPSMALAGWL
uniref:Uncharacterized protein n=1 Tax=Anguilla anguilla TaxID=7936 RepID=A0A0E9W2H0_ANGAN